MRRRSTIKLIALGSGAVFATPIVSSLFSSCNQEPNHEAYEPEFFLVEDMPLLASLVTVLIPETDSPSAAAVGVHKQLDHMIAGLYTSEEKDAFQSNFSALKTYLNTAGEQAFLDLDTEAQEFVLQQLIRENSNSTKTERDTLLSIKNQSVSYYLNTAEIAKNHLNYLPVPGPFLPCVPLEELNGKAWAI